MISIPTMRIQMVGDAKEIVSGKDGMIEETRSLRIDRIYPIDDRELSDYLNISKLKKLLNEIDTILLNKKEGSNTYTDWLSWNNICLYGHPKSEDDNQVNHFIYCIREKEILKDTTICVLSLLQKTINRKDMGSRYEYASSLFYMKLPSYEGGEAFDSANNNINAIPGETMLSMGVKKRIIQLVEYRNQCFKDMYNSTFYEGQLMDRPVKLTNNLEAHIMVHQPVFPLHLLTIMLQDEVNTVVSGISLYIRYILYIYIRKECI
jgi:hypothetical protein